MRKSGSAPRSSPATSSCLEPTPRTGLSLAHPSYPFPGCRHKVNAPGHILRRPLKTLSSPFGFFATPLNPVSPGPGGIKAMNPLPDFIPAFPAAAEFPLPLGIFGSPADRSVPSSLPPEKLTVQFARFPFAPRRPLTFWQSAFGSSFQVRYVSPGSTVP